MICATLAAQPDGTLLLSQVAQPPLVLTECAALVLQGADYPLFSLLQFPTVADAQTAFMWGFGTVLVSYLAGWGVGAVLRVLTRKE